MRQDPLGLDNPASSAPDSSQTLTSGAQQALVNAQRLARECQCSTVESVHLLLGALQIEPPDAPLEALLLLSGLKRDEVQLYAQSALEQRATLAPDEPPRLGQSARRALRLAGTEASRTYSAQVDVSHIFVACFRRQSNSGLAEVLAPLGVSADQLSFHLRGLVRGQTAAATADQSPLAQLTQHGERAIEAAHAAMRGSFCGRISTLHLLIGILENPEGDAVVALQTLMINVEELRQKARAALTSDGEVAGPQRRFTPAAKRALDRAKAAAREGGRSHIGSADLMMGLLPQSTLLIERAQFGARPDDPAAPLLREVDADLFRAVFNPRQTSVPVTKERQVTDSTSDVRFKLFVTFFCFQLSICIALGMLDFWQKSVAKSNAATLLTLLLMAVLIGSAFVTCGTLMFSKSATRKANWQWGFVGAVAGMLLGITVSNGFR